ncbi:ABC transporter ATP-binding protein [Micromonospora sp. PSH03]|uniref:Monosaccharide-transporting ATPase n=5 Tax=Micromonospora TaxID=1873 RepID=A0A328N056_9ACTN|nr:MULTISPECIES: ABC transporter ATP-binding protein [Micromonospora]WTI06992.1 ABC transporter ATP-binding protein [Micromonospora sp. NBC_00821]KAB1917861.1 ABC transporter ATP-binding protein [Micromonospora noduli]MCG5458495.1 ABC transporter ATP-binding protein [Micromonospora salmantinae]MCX5121016.1 ABC transporter ATP-binding protein [Micromonospora sp. NBC_00362]RAN93676.1 Monosaccharide-transporting ATPase [Micromonospora saelicesensis]
MTSPVITVEHGVVGYDGRPVLRDISLTVTAGEVVAILGANGSGKSTLIRAVLGLVPISAGSVTLFDRPLRRFRQWARIGYVPQRLGAGGGVPATVREVVASGRLARRGVLRPPGRADRSAVDAALGAVGLADRAGDPVSTLSGGQQQRTLIARALAGQPELLVLDEPTAGVDAASQEAFAGALRDFVGDGGTVLLVAHELGPLRPVISRAVVVHEGRIAHDGAVPDPAGHHAEPDHDHVHPHCYDEPAGLWSN